MNDPNIDEYNPIPDELYKIYDAPTSAHQYGHETYKYRRNCAAHTTVKHVNTTIRTDGTKCKKYC
jgi:hypothetical protein